MFVPWPCCIRATSFTQLPTYSFTNSYGPRSLVVRFLFVVWFSPCLRASVVNRTLCRQFLLRRRLYSHLRAHLLHHWLCRRLNCPGILRVSVPALWICFCRLVRIHHHLPLI